MPEERKILDNTFNFDEASIEWRKNKTLIKNGHFRYSCCKITKNNNKCLRKPYLKYNFCKMHLNLLEKYK